MLPVKSMTQYNETYFMQLALEQAESALNKQEVPIGSIVVDEHTVVIGSGYNQIESQKNQLAHAEIIAIQQAVEAKKDWRLDQCTLFVTIEPCMMCLGLAHLSRIETIIFGASSPLFGMTQLFGDKPYANHRCNIKGGLFAKESAFYMQQFFKTKR
jgi:tRNA(adenine34) deaminase